MHLLTLRSFLRQQFLYRLHTFVGHPHLGVPDGTHRAARHGSRPARH